VREVDDAITAAQAGADFIGLVFAPGRRQVTLENARHIADAVHQIKPDIEVVGVFVNELPHTVNTVARDCRLDRVQLSGDESIAYCRAIERPLFKVVHVTGITIASDISDTVAQWYKNMGDESFICMLDTAITGKSGGTGLTFDWQIAGQVAARYPVMIAGGLNRDNIKKLLSEALPWGVDVSSGVETDGVKDKQKIRDFIKTVRSFEGR